MKTRFAEKLYAHDEEGVAAGYPLKRLGVPADVAAAVAFLVSDDASWITGDTIRDRRRHRRRGRVPPRLRGHAGGRAGARRRPRRAGAGRGVCGARPAHDARRPGTGTAVARHLRRLGRRAACHAPGLRGRGAGRGARVRHRAAPARPPLRRAGHRARCGRTSTPARRRPDRRRPRPRCPRPRQGHAVDTDRRRADRRRRRGRDRRSPRAAGPPAEQTAYGVVVPAGAAAAPGRPGRGAVHGLAPGPRPRRAGRRSSTPSRTATARCCWRRPRWPAAPGSACPELQRPPARAAAPVGVSTARDDAPGRAGALPRRHAARAPTRPVAFGAATPLVHPASGFSVATALTACPRRRRRPVRRTGPAVGRARRPRRRAVALAARRRRRAPAAAARPAHRARHAARPRAGVLRGVLPAARRTGPGRSCPAATTSPGTLAAMGACSAMRTRQCAPGCCDRRRGPRRSGATPAGDVPRPDAPRDRYR